jgi:hypothetical protein
MTWVILMPCVHPLTKIGSPGGYRAKGCASLAGKTSESRRGGFSASTHFRLAWCITGLDALELKAFLKAATAARRFIP